MDAQALDVFSLCDGVEKTIRAGSARRGAMEAKPRRGHLSPNEMVIQTMHAKPASIGFRQTLRPDDVPILTEIVRATGKFSPAEVDIAAELLQANLARGDASEYYVTVAELDGKLVGYTCCGPIPCTRSSYDLYWIVVDPRSQGRGVGQALMVEFEARVRGLGGTHVFIDTSLRADYGSTRAFYQRCGYCLEAKLADFYGPGDGKAIFSKNLSAAR